MLNLEYETIINDPVARTTNYASMVRSYYDCVTAIYRLAWGDSYHFALFSGSESLPEALIATERMIVDDGKFRAGLKILDVGCGIGGPALNIAAYSGAHITGLDLVKQHIEIARQKAAELDLEDLVSFVLGDAMNMPFPDGSFDCVYLFESGCHTPDKAIFYKECARVLKAGGLFIGLDWMRREHLTLEAEEEYIEPICRYCALPNMITLTELSSYLKDAGLVPELLEDRSLSGNILRNWEPFDNQLITSIKGFSSESIWPAQRTLKQGGAALRQAAVAGAFIIGYWRAHKQNGDQHG